MQKKEKGKVLVRVGLAAIVIAIVIFVVRSLFNCDIDGEKTSDGKDDD